MNYYIVKPKEGYFEEYGSLSACIVGADSKEEALDFAASFDGEYGSWRIWTKEAYINPGGEFLPKDEIKAGLEATLLDSAGVLACFPNYTRTCIY